MADFLIKIVVDPSSAKRGAADAEKALNNVQTKANSLRTSINNAFKLISLSLIIKETAALADEYNNIQNKLRNVTTDSFALAEITKQLGDVANRTRASFSATATLYSRIAANAKELGKTQEELIQFTESLNKAVALSGATASESAAGLLQLSQALASGRLQGDELRSILENLPAVADVISKSLGVTRGELRAMGKEGSITADVIFKAFGDARQELDERFNKSVVTAGQAFVVFLNQAQEFVARADKFIGASKNIAEAFSAGGASIEIFAAAVGAILFKLSPFVTTVLALAGLISKLITDAKNAGIEFSHWATDADQLTRNLEGTAKALQGLSAQEIADLGISIDQFGKAVANVTKVARPADVEVIPPGLKEELGSIDGFMTNLVGKFEAAGQAITGFARDAQAAGEVTNFEENLKDEAAILELVVAGHEDLARVLQFEQSVRGKGVVVTDQQRAELAAREANNIALRNQATLLGEITGPQDRLIQGQQALGVLLDKNKISQDQYNQKLRELQIAALEADTTLEGGFSRGLLKIRAEIDDVGGALEGTLVNAFHSAEDALVTFIRTGEFSFEQFVNSLLDDIARLLVKLLILQAIQVATGTAPAGGLFSLATRAEGGPVSAGEPYLVGEQGPEIFSPAGNGSIIPADQTAAMLANGNGGGQGSQQTMVVPAPNVNVQVINVTDKNEIPAAMDSSAGDKVILNALSRNKESAKRLMT